MSEPTYAPTTWVNDTAPALSADNMNHIESGVQAATERAAASVRTDAAQTLTPGEQTQAQDNLGLPAVLSGYAPVSSLANYTTAKQGAETSKWTNALSTDRRVTLIGGQADETVIVSGSGTPTVSADTTNFKLGTQGWACAMAAAGTGVFKVIPPGEPLALGPIHAVGMWVYVPSTAGLTQVTIDIDSASNTWSGTLNASSTPVLAAGWNMIRWSAASGTLAALSSIVDVRVLVVSTAATTVTVGHVWVECAPKARLVIIADGVYGSAFANAQPITAAGYSLTAEGYGGYADLQARGCPVVLAPDTGLVGSSGVQYQDRASWARLAAMMADGNGNEMNYHGSTGNPTASMTAAQLITECVTAIKALQYQGYPTPLAKAAFSQNQASNAAAIKPYHLALPSSTNQSGTPAWTWPPTDPYNFPRYELTNSTISTDFGTLQSTNGVMFSYMHGVSPSVADFVTPSQWATFLSLLDGGLNGGWLEVVTLDTLFARSGLKQRQTQGDRVAEYFDASGTRQQTRLL